MFKMFNEIYSKNCLGVMWDNSLIGMAFVSLKGEWLDVNPALCELLGYSSEELKHLTFQDVTHPQDLNDDLKMVDKVINQELDYYTMTKRYITKHGNTIWIKLKVNPVYEPDNPDKKVGFLFSQVLPFDVQLVEKSTNKVLPPSPVFIPFIKTNWKWLSTSIGTLVLGIGGFFYNQSVSVSSLQKEVSTLQRDMVHITDSLEMIKDLLKR